MSISAVAKRHQHSACSATRCFPLRTPRMPAPAWACAGITLLLSTLAFGVTAATLGRENFWLDELSSLYFSDPGRSFHDTVREIWRDETNPPLYYLYLYLWRHLVSGTDEASIRAASLVPAALACLSPLFYPSRIMRLERRLAVVLLLSFSPGLLYYAGEARGYALLLLFSVNMCFLLLLALQTLRQDGAGLAYKLVLLGAFSAAAAWTHLFGALLAAVFFFVLVAASIVLRRRRLAVAVAAAATAVAVTICPLAHLTYMGKLAADHWFIELSRAGLLRETKWIGHLAFGDKLSILAFTALTLAALAHAWRPMRTSKTAFYLSLPLFFGLVLALSLAIPIYYGRYLVILLPAIYVVVVEAVGDASDRLRAPAWLPFAAVLLLAPLLVSAWPTFDTVQREDWRAQAAVINATEGCKAAPVFAVAPNRDSGDPASLYGHYLDPSRGIELIPVQAGIGFDPKALARVWRSSCPVKVWGAHMEAWQLRALAGYFAGFPSGFRLLPFRNGFLLLTGGAEQIATRPDGGP